MIYRDEIDALASYEANIRAARDQYRLHEITADHLMGGKLKAMHKRLFHEFKAKADDALAYLNSIAQEAA